MAEKKTRKEKVEIATRAPQKRGIFDNLGKDRQQNVKHPLSEIIIFPSDENELPKDLLDGLDRLEGLPKETEKYPIAPARDYAKLPNSIRRAIKQGVFQGCSLQIYLYLYSLTRGAIQPARTVRTTKPRMKAGAGIGSDVTLNKHLNHLKSSGYLKIVEIRGQYHGNEYEVLIPEEVTRDPLDGLDRLDHLDLQFLDRLDGLETRPSRPSETVENKTTYERSKTSFKDNTKNDDDARANETFSVMNEKLAVAAKKLTGKSSSEEDADKWGQLAELLILEMEAAASRTNGISSAPAFLTEVLRRKLLNGNLSASAKTPKAKVDLVGKPNAAGEYEKKPLDEAGRVAALEELRDFANDEFLGDFRKWYTAADWTWLMKELGKTDKISEAKENPVG